jgi:hypothetical protein
VLIALPVAAPTVAPDLAHAIDLLAQQSAVIAAQRATITALRLEAHAWQTPALQAFEAILPWSRLPAWGHAS